MFGLLLSSIIAFSSHAQADQKYEVSLTSSVQWIGDPRWETVSATPFHRATGINVGMEVLDNISFLMGFNTGKAGSMILIPTASDDLAQPVGFNIVTTISQYQMGMRYRWQWNSRWAATLTAQGQIATASMRMDEDIESQGTEVSLKYRAKSFGSEIGVGTEYTMAYLSDDQVRINIGFETGMTKLSTLNFDSLDGTEEAIPLGSLNKSGAYLNMYVGSRF
jgi:hypothetical protein